MSYQNDSHYYPWQIELYSWHNARSQNIQEREKAQDLLSAQPAKMSNLLRCVKEARARPEIWSKFVRMSDRLKSGSLTKTEIVEGSFEESDEASALLSQFTSWFQIKNRTCDASPPYSLCFLVLKEMACRDGNIDDQSIIKIFLQLDSLVDTNA